MAFVPDKQPGRFVPDAPPDADETPVPPAPESPLVTHAKGLVGAMTDLGVNQNPIAGAVEKVAQGATGLGSTVLGGYAGLGHMVLKSLGLADGEPADTVRAVQNAGTYQPRTNAAAQIDNAVGAVQKPIESAVAPIDQATQNAGPGVRTFVPAAENAATQILGLLGPGKLAAERGAAAAGAAGDTTVEGAAKPVVGTGSDAVQTGRSVGFKFTPGGVESRNPAAAINGEVPQSFAVSPADRRAINLHNQAKTTELAGNTLGKDGATSLAPKDFDDAKTAPLKVYSDTGAAAGTGLTGSDDFQATLGARLADDTQTKLKPAVATQAQRILNAAQSGNLAGPQMVKDISWMRANGGRSVANMLENEMESQLGANSPQLQKFRDARTALAQINTLQEATKGGQIDASALARIDQENPKLLTGNLKVIAQSAAASPQDFRLPSGVQPGTSPISKPTVAGAAKAIAGKLAKVAAPGRFDITTDAFQNRLGREMSPTEASYVPSLGARPAPPSQALTLAPPPGGPIIEPRQGTLTLPPGLPPRPVVDLAPPPGPVIEPHQYPLGQFIADPKAARALKRKSNG